MATKPTPKDPLTAAGYLEAERAWAEARPTTPELRYGSITASIRANGFGEAVLEILTANLGREVAIAHQDAIELTRWLITVYPEALTDD